MAMSMVSGSVEGSLYTFSCNYGYSLVGEGNLQCTSEGRWNASIPKCLKGTQRLHLSRDSLLALIHAFITSRLDFCNGLLYGLPKSQIVKLQRIQNAAARLAMNIGKYSHVTQALQDLHWLQVRARIHFKILILVFKAIHGLAPPYISDLITVKPKSSYHLRSNSSLLLEPPKEKMLSTLSARSFYAAAPCLWNSLPAELRDIQSLCNFKRKLKTHLFRAG